jgi:predicted ATPase/DNA-binding winged helix-turn-helix (wHTH) protein
VHSHSASEQSSVDWIAFGPFVLQMRSRALTRDGQTVTLNRRSIDLLMALVECPGKTVSKADLMKRIWPDRIVEEVNLRVVVTALRRRLAESGTGEAYILNMIGRGYAFSSTVPLQRWPSTTEGVVSVESRPAEIAPGRLPLLLKPVIGRDESISRIEEMLERNRLVTIVGAAGIGKTTVAISTAAHLSRHDGEVCFVDFAPLRDAPLVPARIAAALSVEHVGADPLPAILECLADRRILLIFDNCEHVLDAIAAAASTILQHGPDIRIVTTSREALRVDGEALFRLEGLAYPAADFTGGACDALGYSAVQLLVERVQAGQSDFLLADALTPFAIEICRRLDGIPLAIQLAASRVLGFGLTGVAARLDDRFGFLNHGNRAGQPRHQTLAAAIAWSFDLLEHDERIVLERIAIFRGQFSIEAAADVAGWAPVSPDELPIIVADLVEKSMLAAVADATGPRYFFLETIRDFARDSIRTSEADDELFRRLARRIAFDCEHFRSVSSHGPSAQATIFARGVIDDLRYVLQRSFEMRDTVLASSLVLAAVPMMLHLGRAFELKDWIERALRERNDTAERLALLINLGGALHHSGCDPNVQRSIYDDAVNIAESLGDGRSVLLSRWGLVVTAYAERHERLCLWLAEDLRDAARSQGDDAAMLVGGCLMACALHDLADYRLAREQLEHVLANYSVAQSVNDTHRYGLNHRMLALCALGSVTWQTGDAAKAEDLLEQAAVAAGDHLPSLFIALAHSVCIVSIERADWATASIRIEALKLRFGHNLQWSGWIANLEAIVVTRRDRTIEAFDRLDGAILSGDWSKLPNRQIWMILPIIQCCIEVGRLELAAKLADQLVQELVAKEVRWILPEGLRLKAVVAAMNGDTDAESLFESAAVAATVIGAEVYSERVRLSHAEYRDRALSVR